MSYRNIIRDDFIQFLDGLYRRLLVCRKIWPYMLGIFLNYMVTLSLFPGIESEIQSCLLGDWMPVILLATFNITDILGKVTLMYLSVFKILTLR